MRAGDIGPVCIMCSFAMGSVTAGLLLQEFGRADKGEEILLFGVVLGWFLVVLLVITWRDKNKKEKQEWLQKEKERDNKQ